MAKIPNAKKLNLFKVILKLLSQEKAKLEIKNLQEDFKRFDVGALLLVRGAYPSATLVFSFFMGMFFSVNFIPGMKEVVDQYFQFIEDIKDKNP